MSFRLSLPTRLARLAIAAASILVMLGAPVPAGAQQSWLDGPLYAWNQAGADVPLAPYPPDDIDPPCTRQIRAPQTAEEQAVSDAGWLLVGDVTQSRTVMAIQGATGFDGMCRPYDYQFFVFADHQFAGTIAPDPMDSRTDGSGFVRGVTDDAVVARFARYADTDPLCCPNTILAGYYRIRRGPDGPVLIPVQSAIDNP